MEDGQRFKDMKIANRSIGINYPPLVVAEIGINHGGDLEVAKTMVNAAYKAGCEMIKHQTHFVEDEMTSEAKDIYPPNANKSIWHVMEECSLSRDEEINLKKFTEAKGMIYISTPFSRDAADFLNDIGVPAFKIGSGECNHRPLIDHISRFNKPIIMSTGMQSIKTLKPSINIIESYNLDYALLECTNLYPSPPEFVSLKGISELRENFPKAIIGFSDHSIGPSISLGAVALGSSIIEKHFSDTRYRKGPDIICSMDPCELKFLIDRSKEIFTALNTPKIRSMPENEVYKFARGSVVADRDINIGEEINSKDIWARRPGSGEISVDDFEKLIGLRTNRFIKKNMQLEWKFFER